MPQDNLSTLAGLARDDKGVPMFTVMTAPQMNGERAFVSLVPAGANRRELVAKSEVPVGEQATPAVTMWYQRMLNPASWFGADGAAFLAMATKMPDPTTFDAALAVNTLNNGLWRSTDSLQDVIHNILEDETVSDKIAAIDAALTQFHKHILAIVAPLGVMKAVDGSAKQMAGAARKAGRVISDKNMTSLQDTVTALAAGLTTLQGLIEAAKPKQPDESKTAQKMDCPSCGASNTDGATMCSACGAMMPSSAKKGDTMKTTLTPQQAGELATAAAKSAMDVMKLANPAATTEQLVTAGLKASEAVMKAAVGGEPQPSMLTNALQQQLAGQMITGTPPDLISILQRGLLGAMDTNNVPAMKAAADQLEQIKTSLEAATKGAGASGTIVPVAPATDDAAAVKARLETLTKQVQLLMTTPRPANAAPSVPVPTEKASDGGLNALFSNTPFNPGWAG